MDRTTLNRLLEEVETTEEYNGIFLQYWQEAIRSWYSEACWSEKISVQIHQWAKVERVSGFLKEKFGIKPTFHATIGFWSVEDG